VARRPNAAAGAKDDVQGDGHPVAKLHVNGPPSNLPGFQEAFHCAADASMVRPEKERCEVW
jgi:predicted metalloendopeptidase